MTVNEQDDPNPMIAWAVKSMQAKIDKARAQRDQQAATARTMAVIAERAS